MEASTLVGAVLTSTVIASLLTAIVTLHVAGRSALSDNVIKHRANWRDALRTIGSQLAEAVNSGDVPAIAVARNQLVLNLNPTDPEDQALVHAVRDLESCASTQRRQKLDEIERRMALLLKHDWERAKWEARFFRFGRRTPKRIPFSGEVDMPVVDRVSSKRTAWRFVAAWSCMVGGAAALFFLAAGLSAPFTQQVIAFNDVNQHHGAREWIAFGIASLLVGLFWSPAYLLFKAGEKVLVERLLKSRS